MLRGIALVSAVALLVVYAVGKMQGVEVDGVLTGTAGLLIGAVADYLIEQREK